MPWPVASRPAKTMVGLGLDIVVERVVEGGMGEEIEGVGEVRLDWASDDYVPILRMKVENGSIY